MTDLPYKPKSLRVLIVDDHDPIRKAIKRILVAAGFTDITECFDGEDAIQATNRVPYDLIICDLYMRNVNGFNVLQHVRQRNMGSDVPFIVVTGEAERDEIVKVADYGADDYILKPFQADDLDKKVVSVLSAYFSPSPLLSCLRQAERHYLIGDYKIAKAAFEEALKIDATSMRATYGRSKSLAKTGSPTEALDLLEETVKGNQSFYKNFAAIADLQLKMGRVKEAIKAMRSELEINPKQSGRQILMAKLLMKEGDPLSAIDHFREALKESPNIKAALMGMGLAFAKLDNIEKSFYYLKRVRRYHPMATKALDTAVKIGLMAGEEKKVELFLKDEKNSRPERRDIYLTLARFYVHQNRYEDAITVLNELLVRDPENISGKKMKGLVFLRMKEFRKAEALFTEVIATTPDIECYQSLAEAKIALGALAQAIDVLHQSMTLDQANGRTFMFLADVYVKTQQFAKAYLCYRRAAVCGIDVKLCQEQAREMRTNIQTRRMPPRAS